ncbi:MAG TPA: ribose-phosphate pyrophosphokinase [Patescibacteria group bacterium]|nr:ribose-phosphate pyrophosphokinase [Patescibacteria group bacterium]
MILLSGSSNQPFAQKIAQNLGGKLGAVELSKFPDDELRVRVLEEVKGQDVALIQSFSTPVDSNIIEFSLLTDALFRLGARRVFAVIPWLGYSLQDKVFLPGEPIAAKVIATILSSLSIYRFILMSLHNNSIQGFFTNPSSVLSADEIFAQDIQAHQNVVLVAPDFGGLKRVGKFAGSLNLPYVNIDKHRDLTTGQVTVQSLSGDVSGKTAVIVDDVINGGSTAVETAKVLREKGATKIIMYVTHALLADDAGKKLQDSELDEVVVTDTVDTSKKSFAKLRVLSVASVFAKELADWSK